MTNESAEKNHPEDCTAVTVLAAHRLTHKRPAMPGPGEAWTCGCGIFRVSPVAQDAHDHHVATHLAGLAGLSDDVRTISRTISASYPPDLDAEAHLWRRCMKVTEEAGEVFQALAGTIGENPRKGQTHTRDDLRDELLDVAGAALGAVSHLDGDSGDPIAWLSGRLAFVRQRLLAAVRTPPEAPTPTREAP